LNGKIQGKGILSNGKLKGRRLLYHLNGNISDQIEYENGLSNGLEKRYYEDGILKQEGIIKNEKEIGTWKAFHPNGQLKNLTPFNEDGKINGKSISYYSTGKIKSSYEYKNGTYIKDKILDKIYKLYNEGQEYYRAGNFKSAIKKYSKCIEQDEFSADAYFARGTARLNEFKFESAKEDFDKTLEIEPYFTNAYANRAFVIIRKYEFANSRDIKGIKGVKIMSSKKAVIPEKEKTMVCKDLKKAVSLGDNNWMTLDALKNNCKK
jgi:tetratricopeptide (TPR) repeat protein